MSQAEYYEITRRLDALERREARIADLEAMVARLCEERAGERPPPLPTDNPYFQEAAHKGKRAR